MHIHVVYFTCLSKATCIEQYADVCIIQCDCITVLYITGTNYAISRLSPETIIIDLPEKLVIEVEAAGAYDHIEWRKNGQAAGFNVSSFPGDVRIFPNFFEMHVMDPTSADTDLGRYDIQLIGTINHFEVMVTALPYGE